MHEFIGWSPEQIATHEKLVTQVNRTALKLYDAGVNKMDIAYFTSLEDAQILEDTLKAAAKVGFPAQMIPMIAAGLFDPRPQSE
jgi:hypothetical protein